MKRYVKPNQSSLPTPTTPQPSTAEDFSDLDTGELLQKTLAILRREVSNLMGQSAQGKLDETASRDLVNYIKLLSSIEKEQQEKLSDMTDEELKKAAKKAK